MDGLMKLSQSPTPPPNPQLLPNALPVKGRVIAVPVSRRAGLLPEPSGGSFLLTGGRPLSRVLARPVSPMGSETA